MKINKWQKRHFNRAKEVASWSKDPSTKVGCVAVVDDKVHLMDGYNGLPDYLDDDNPDYWVRPDKYDFVEHAERNMVSKMKKYGVNPTYYDLFMLWFPCPTCMRSLIESGCKTIYCDLQKHKLNKSQEYKKKFFNSFLLALKAEVKIYYTDDGERLHLMTIEEIKKMLSDG